MTRVALLALIVAYPLAAQPAPQVVDGDTFRFQGEAIRILNIDAPELLHPGCLSEYAAALRARDRLAEMLAAGVVIQRRGRDWYGRTLATIADLEGRDVGEALVAEGLARPWDGRRRAWCAE